MNRRIILGVVSALAVLACASAASAQNMLTHMGAAPSGVTTAPGTITATFEGNVVNGSTNLQSFTFASYPFGPASSARQIQCFAWSNSSATTTFTTLGSSIGGVAVTVDAVLAAADLRNIVAFHANVPTGTSGSVVTNYSGNQLRTNLACWSISGSSQVGPTVVSNGGVVSQASATSLSVPAISVPASGVMLAAAFNGDATNATTVTPSAGSGTLEFEAATSTSYRAAGWDSTSTGSTGLTIANVGGTSQQFRGVSLAWKP